MVVLSDPTERAVRHWRALSAAIARDGGRRAEIGAGGGSGSGSGGSGGGRAPLTGAGGVGGVARLHVRGDASHLLSYTNGSTLLQKLRAEATQLTQCVDAAAAGSDPSSGSGSVGNAGGGGLGSISVSAWHRCITLACNWYECVLGTGLYAPQLRHWLRYFGPERFLLLEETSLRSSPATVAKRLSAFLHLGSPLTASALLAAAGNRSAAPVVGDSVRRLLKGFYDKQAPDVRQLFRELAPDSAAAAASVRWLHPNAALSRRGAAGSAGGGGSSGGSSSGGSSSGGSSSGGHSSSAGNGGVDSGANAR